MRKIVFTLLMALTISTGALAQTTTANGTTVSASINNKVYDETINTMEQIDKAVAKAKAEKKYVICQVGGNWCPWCLRFAKFITDDAEIKALIDANFIYEHVNYPSKKGDREAAKQTMNRLNNPQRFGFPVLVVLNADGQVIHIQDSSFLEEGQGYSKEKVIRFFKNWTPQAVEGE